MFDDILAIIFFRDVLEYLDVSALPIYTSFDAKGVFTTQTSYRVGDDPYPPSSSYIDFTGYIQKLQEKVSSWGAPEIVLYKKDCETLKGCKYNEDVIKCMPNSEDSPEKDHEQFKLILYAVCAIILMKELVKLVVILVLMKLSLRIIQFSSL